MVHKRIVRHVGNRGLVLMTLGIIWTLTGYGRLTNPPREVGLPHERVNAWGLAALWALPGLFAIVAAIWRKLDATGWGLLSVPPGGMLLSYVAGFIFAGYRGPWLGACIYAAVVLLINRCAAGLDRSAPWGGEERRRWTDGKE